MGGTSMGLTVGMRRPKTSNPVASANAEEYAGPRRP
jgi:hypothetical protein